MADLEPAGWPFTHGRRPGANVTARRPVGATMSIASGHADTGLGVRPAATALNLEFVPVIWEEFDVVLTGDALAAADQRKPPAPRKRRRSAAQRVAAPVARFSDNCIVQV